jgi:hypothetical protein
MPVVWQQDSQCQVLLERHAVRDLKALVLDARLVPAGSSS